MLFYILLGCITQTEEHYIDFDKNGKIGGKLRKDYIKKFEENEQICALDLMRISKGYRPCIYDLYKKENRNSNSNS
jgi:hypothetical protein